MLSANGLTFRHRWWTKTNKTVHLVTRERYQRVEQRLYVRSRMIQLSFFERIKRSNSICFDIRFCGREFVPVGEKIKGIFSYKS